MDGFRDRASDALRTAAAPALERIRNDRELEGLPAQIQRLLVYLESHLFDRELNVTTWRQGAGIRDNSVSTAFRDWLGTTPLTYFVERRLETSARMLALGDLEGRQVARVLGFNSYRAFRDRYRAWTGRLPAEDSGGLAPEVELSSFRRALRGELSDQEAGQLIAKLREIYPDAEATEESPQASTDAQVKTVVDGSEYERFHADRLWRRIRALPSKEQKRCVRGHLFQSTAFFDLLRTKSRQEGRRDRQHGVRVAELAVVSLEGHDQVFGDRIHDLRALGWAWLANAKRLAFDFASAEKDLERADRQWATPRAERDLKVSAVIRMLRGGLLMCQGRLPEAAAVLDESIRLSESTGNNALQAEALIQRASVSGYMNRPEESIPRLQSALQIVPDAPYLVFAATTNLIHILARLGKAREAAQSLPALKRLSETLGQPLTTYQTQWIEAVVRHGLGERQVAEELYMQAWSGFSEMGELTSFGLISLDMSIFFFEGLQRRRATALAHKAIQIFQTSKLRRETIASIELLAKELDASQMTELALRKIQQRLVKDPLVTLL